jgi:hypothetical protein
MQPSNFKFIKICSLALKTTKLFFPQNYGLLHNTRVLKKVSENSRAASKFQAPEE